MSEAQCTFKHNISDRFIVKLIRRRRISDPHLFLDYNLSGGKYGLHINYWNNTFNRQRFHFSGKDIHVHDSKALGENKSQENETMKYKSNHRV